MNGKSSSNGLFSLNPNDYLVDIISYSPHFLVLLFLMKIWKVKWPFYLFIASNVSAGMFSKQRNFVTKKSVVANAVKLTNCKNLA